MYIGTQHQGVYTGTPADDFASWTAHRSADKTPNVSFGEGLPSNYINDILVAGDDTVYAATDTGLATSTDGGEHWTFLRGRDWKDKAGAKANTEVAEPEELLSEDYVTCLTQDTRGLLWIGYRRDGYEARRPLQGLVPFYSPENKTDAFPYVSSILPLDDGSVLLGYYNQGAQLSVKIPPFAPTPAEQKWARVARLAPEALPTVAALPTAAGAPSLDRLQSLLDLARNRPPAADAPAVVFAARRLENAGHVVGALRSLSRHFERDDFWPRRLSVGRGRSARRIQRGALASIRPVARCDIMFPS